MGPGRASFSESYAEALLCQLGIGAKLSQLGVGTNYVGSEPVASWVNWGMRPSQFGIERRYGISQSRRRAGASWEPSKFGIEAEPFGSCANWGMQPSHLEPSKMARGPATWSQGSTSASVRGGGAWDPGTRDPGTWTRGPRPGGPGTQGPGPRDLEICIWHRNRESYLEIYISPY